jgi:2-hydroxycyclohexanecarboxyl-CoA dehydrogenase
MSLTSAARKVAIVTGTASGIGAAAAAELESCGWTVAGFDLRPSPRCSFDLCVDMADPEQVRVAVSRVEQELGPVAAAVSAAGYYEMLPVSEITVDQWRRMLSVHVGGFVNLSRAVIPGMTAVGEGAIVAITSELAIGGGSHDAHYAAAKGTLLGLVRSLAAESAPQGIRVNAVAPGPTDTPLLAADSPWRAPEYLATLPLGRLTSPEEVAICIAFLLDEGTFCVGETLNPNAGAVI